MSSKFLLAACGALAFGSGVYFFSKDNTRQHQNDVSILHEAPQQTNSDIPKQPQYHYSLAKPNTDVGGAIILKFQESPKKPLFNAPCPISTKIQAEIMQRTLPISFKKLKNHRQWSTIVEVLEKDKSINSINEKLRNFIVVLIKLGLPNVYHLFGTSEAGDLIEMTRTAICDEVALAHHRIKFGIDPALGQDFTEHQNLVISKQERVFMETMYRSCRMSSSNAFRYAQTPYTRVAFLPGDDDWSIIKKVLDIDEKRPNEVVCTYKPKP